FDEIEGWKGKEKLPDVSLISGDSVGLTAGFNLKKGEQIKMKIGLSYTTIDNARNNLDTECAGWDFDAVRNNGQKIWNDWLGRIEVKGGTTAQKVNFYTDLWHVLLGRHKI